MNWKQQTYPRIILVCYFCERQHYYPKVIVDIHHRFSTFLGGMDTPENKIFLCRQCHSVFEWITVDGFDYPGPNWNWRHNHYYSYQEFLDY